MIDIHSHILPAIDDGAGDLQTSLAMAALAVEDGIEAVIATPHTDGNKVNPAAVELAVVQLREQLMSRDIALEVVAGYEVPSELVADLPACTMAGSDYVLVEFPHDYFPANAAEIIYGLVQNGLKPIIAHPERNNSVLSNPDLLSDLVSVGAMLQLTASSVTGDFGPDIQSCSHYLLRNNMVHFLATDSHSPTFREPILSKARKAAARIIGRKEADRLVYDNPREIIKNGNL